jgi:hypothetical protein
MMPRYPNAPSQGRTDTSAAAAQAIRPASAAIQLKVYDVIRAAGRSGLTADEVAASLRLDRVTVRPRTTELRHSGKIHDSGLRRRNENGKSAIVWVAT